MSDKSRYIRLIEFKKFFDSSSDLTAEMIPALLEWEEVKLKKFDAVNIIANPISIVILAAIISQLFNFFGASDKGLEVMLAMLYLFVVAVLLFSTALEVFYSSRKRSFEICRLLRWLHIEYVNCLATSVGPSTKAALYKD